MIKDCKLSRQNNGPGRFKIEKEHKCKTLLESTLLLKP